MSDFFKKIFGNQVIDDLSFPEIPVHTHDGQNSPVLAPSSIDTIQIKAGAVSNIVLADDSVTSDKIIDNAVMTEHLNALAVTESKLATAAVATGKIKNGAVTATKLIQTEAVVTLSAQIAEAVIISAHIGTGVIQNAHLGNAIITTAKVQDLAVEWAKIGNLSVGNSKIMDLAVSTGKVQDLSVTTGKINDLAVEWAKIGSLAVGNSKIMNEAVGTSKIQDLAVNTAKIDDLAVSTAKIQDLAVSNAKIASLTAGKITAGQFNLTDTGYLSCPYGGIRIGYLTTIGGVKIYGIGADIGHGIMLNAGGADGYSRLWIDDSANKPLCLDCNAKDRFFIKAASGNDIVRFYGNAAWAGGFIDILVPFRPVVRSASEPGDPVQGEIYYDSNPGEGGAGGRLKVWNGFSWHCIAWFDDI
jgi:hypothetical protein